MAKDITGAKKRAIDRVTASIARARVLHDRAVNNGRWQNPQGGVGPFSNADKRDLTEFIFFESAAAFKHFCQHIFILAARRRFTIQPKFALPVIGHIDRGLSGIMGWAAPSVLVSRGRALFGKRHWLATLGDNLPGDTYDWLTYAHRVRNRIAHPGEQAVAQTMKLLGTLGVPQASRSGLSMGRLLLEYPAANAPDDRWFHRFLTAYDALVTLARQRA